MCKPDSIGSRPAGQDRSLFLFSVKSFDSHGGVPSAKAQIFTGAILILALVAIEQSLRIFFTSIKVRRRGRILWTRTVYGQHIWDLLLFDTQSFSLTHCKLFFNFQDFDPILDNETNRNILARHVGVDAFSAMVVAYLGYRGRHVYQNLLDAITGKNPKAMPVAYEERMFTYHPEGQRVLLFFTAYQIKNLADTIVWNDGILFIIHHVLALGAAVSNSLSSLSRMKVHSQNQCRSRFGSNSLLWKKWGGLNGHSQFYSMFYMGVSEISTGGKWRLTEDCPTPSLTAIREC